MGSRQVKVKLTETGSWNGTFEKIRNGTRKWTLGKYGGKEARFTV